MYKPTYKNKKEHEAYIGKKAFAYECVIAGTTGKHGTIMCVIGDDREGYRFELQFDKPLDYSFKRPLTKIYPPTFLVIILEKENND